MIDPVEAVRKFLQSQDALISATTKDHDHGIYRANPRGIKGQIAPKCVVLSAAGGRSEDYPYLTARIYARCYGPTDAAATEIFRRVWDVFYPGGVAHNPTMINNRWLLRYASLTQPIAMTEPEGWAVALSTLTVHMDPTVGV